MTRRDPYKSTDAGRATSELGARELGYKSQHDLERARTRQGKYTDDAARRRILLPTRTLGFYVEATTGTTSPVMRRSPKTATVMTTTVRFPMGAAGKVIGASLWCTSACTGGSGSLNLRIGNAGGTELNNALPDVVIDGSVLNGHTRNQAAEWLCPVPNGIRFATGDEIRLQLVLTGWTSASTPDWAAELIIAYDGLS